MKNETPQVAEQTANITPDFFIIPGDVMKDPELQTMDRIVFAVIYWFEKMKDGYCRASNATIAKVSGSSSSGVANSLVRLRSTGHIACDYDENGNRLAIITLTHFSKGGYSNEEGGVTGSSNILIKSNKEELKYTSNERKMASDLHRLYVLHYRTLPAIGQRPISDEDKRAQFEKDLKNYRLTPQRMEKIAARLRDAGYDMCAKAIVNSAKDPWNHGENDRGWKADLAKYIFRSYEMVEELANK